MKWIIGTALGWVKSSWLLVFLKLWNNVKHKSVILSAACLVPAPSWRCIMRYRYQTNCRYLHILHPIINHAGIKLYLYRNKENMYSVHSCVHVMAVYRRFTISLRCAGDVEHCKEFFWDLLLLSTQEKALVRAFSMTVIVKLCRRLDACSGY